MGSMGFVCPGILALFAIFGSAVPLPTPVVVPFMLEDYDLQSLKTDFDTHPAVSTIRSGVHESLTAKTDPKPNGKVVSEDEKLAVDATTELDMLIQMLDQNSKYMEMRDKQDPTWPTTLARKVGTSSATSQEKQTFEKDLYHAISTVVILKMMEERVSVINKFLEKHFMENPKAEIDSVLGGSDALAVAEGLLALKFLEGFLHSTNAMIDEVLVADSSILAPTSQVANTASVIRPAAPAVKDDDIELGISTFIFLLFSAIGFFFVLFAIVFGSLKAIRKCYECTLTSNKKSKYEQI